MSKRAKSYLHKHYSANSKIFSDWAPELIELTRLQSLFDFTSSYKSFPFDFTPTSYTGICIRLQILLRLHTYFLCWHTHNVTIPSFSTPHLHVPMHWDIHKVTNPSHWTSHLPLHWNTHTGTYTEIGAYRSFPFGFIRSHLPPSLRQTRLQVLPFRPNTCLQHWVTDRSPST